MAHYLNFPSTTRAGVVITPKAMILIRSEIFSTSKSPPVALAASSVHLTNSVHLGQPGPKRFYKVGAKVAMER
jgi:hypothetical protein